jgi:hypothetical protein
MKSVDSKNDIVPPTFREINQKMRELDRTYIKGIKEIYSDEHSISNKSKRFDNMTKNYKQTVYEFNLLRKVDKCSSGIVIENKEGKLKVSHIEGGVLKERTIYEGEWEKLWDWIDSDKHIGSIETMEKGMK